MLIQSHRHNPDDLRLWAELEEADAVHAEYVMPRQAVAAFTYLQLFARKGPIGYCSVSWGKDSTVVADLCHRLWEIDRIKVPLVWVRVEPISNPDCELVRDAFLSRWVDAEYHEIVEHCHHDAEHEHTKRIRWIAGGTLEAGFQRACGQFGERRVSGVRADESGARKISARSHGLSTDNSHRPLLYWSSRDVYAYLHARGLPVHPAYAMLGGGRWDRDRIRVASLGGTRGDQLGRAEWEREYYGDIIRRLESANV